MKKVMLSVFATLFLLGTCGRVWAQGDQTGTAAESKRERIRRQLPPSVRPASPNDPRLKAEAERMKLRERERQLARQEREKRQQKMMEMRKKNIGEFEKIRSADSSDQPAGKGRDHQKQLKELQQQLSHVEQKHLERMAKMQRIKELAAQKNSEQTLARVEKLIKREQMRYGRKRQRTQMRINMVKRWEARESQPRTPDEAKLREDARKAMERYKNMPGRKSPPPGARKDAGQKPEP
ncbi:MAG: hypothetical protein ACYTFQ_28765 [Planctomycetota bacterium]|jgi:hypothetical protein